MPDSLPKIFHTSIGTNQKDRDIRIDPGNPSHSGVLTLESSIWPPERLRLSASKNDCVVWKTGTDFCIVSVNDFNQHAGTISLRLDIPLKLARAKILDKAINCQYLVEKSHALGLDSNSEFLHAFERKVRQLQWIGSNARPPKYVELRNLYDENYESRFKKKEWIRFRILASTHPKWLDSVALLVAREDSIVRKSHRKGLLATRKSDSLPWRELSEDALPPDLVEKTDTLGVGEVLGPISTTYGRFLVRIWDAGIRPEKSFEAAQSELHNMAIEKLAYRGKYVSEKNLKNWYRVNGHKMNPEPVLYGRLWVFPQSRVINIEYDTIGHSPQICSTSNLPDAISLPILNRVKNGTSPGALIGPVRTPLGRTLFRVEKILLNKKPASYESVRHRIYGILASNPSHLTEFSIHEHKEFIKKDMLASVTFQNMVTPVFDSQDPQWRRQLATWKSDSLEIDHLMLQDESLP